MPADRREPDAPPPDYVGRLIEAWQVERPDLAVGPVAIIYRIQRLAARLGPEVEKAFRSSGVTGADFAVLAHLRRAGPPYQAGQRDLQEALGLTSGTVSVRIDRLADAGLVRRAADRADGRAVVITLTAAGAAEFDALAPRHLDNEAALLSSLDPGEQATLGRLLHALLVEFESPLVPPGRELGLDVASAPASLERRRAVGLPDARGLLVEAVAPGSPGDRAGVRRGDLIVASGDREVRSLTGLAAAIAGAAREVRLTLRRGAATVEVEVAVSAPTW